MSAARPSSVNHWPDPTCAKAFWGQQELAPYHELLADTTAWLAAGAGDRWLDLGCGCGKLTEALWARSGGKLAEVVGVDVAAANARAFDRLRKRLRPAPRSPGQVRFVQGDFSQGLGSWPDAYFDGAVSGLAVQYAERYCPQRRAWTAEGYDRLLGEVCRVLRYGGWFVFSVNVPDPSWGKVAVHSLPGLLRGGRLGPQLKNAWRLWRYGRWLTKEARRGRFHYLPIEQIVRKLSAAGFVAIEHRLTYVNQAYLIRCRKPPV